jgi:hypothetical protein
MGTVAFANVWLEYGRNGLLELQEQRIIGR